jgi:hypothetical protein
MIRHWSSEMRVLLFLSADETATELSVEIAVAATRVDAGPTAWLDVRDGVPDVAQWLQQADANHVQLAALAATTPERVGAIFDKINLAILVTDLSARSVDRAREFSAELEKSRVAFVMLAKSTGWDEDPLEESSDGDDVEEDEEADACEPAGTIFALAQFGTVCPVPLRGPVAGQAAELWDYIAQRLARLASRGSTQPSHNALAAAGRRFPRWSFDAAAKLSWENQSVACRIDDVSAGGLGLYAEVAPPMKTPVKVEITGFAPMQGAVASVSGQHVGVNLEMPLVDQIGFVRRMAALIAAPALSGGAMPHEVST